MRIAARYSHLNGEEYLLVHCKQLWEEVQEVVTAVDASACRTKVSAEKTMPGRMLFSPKALNRAFKEGLEARGWAQRTIRSYNQTDFVKNRIAVEVQSC